jgi:hypothetical protein
MISRIERWAPIAGLVFVVLMVTGKILVSDVPSPNAPQREIAGYLTDGARQAHNIIGAYLWTVGALAFLLFLMRLPNDLRRAEGGTGTYRTWPSAPARPSLQSCWFQPRPPRRWPMPSGCAVRP